MKGIIFFLKISLVGLLFTISIPTFAYDFEVNGLYYNILSNNQVEVTFKKKNDKGYLGNLLIPEKVVLIPIGKPFPTA